MKPVRSITPAASQHLANTKPVAVAAPLGTVDPQTGDVVDKIFRQLQAIFPAWKQAWPDDKALSAARRSWTKGLMAARINTLEQVRFGIERCRTSGSPFAPSIGQFITWCQPTPEMLGLPTADKAYREAIRNAHPCMAGITKWTHAAVHHAAKECGFFNLNKLPEDASRKLFDSNYTIAVRMVMDGEPLSPIPLALPKSASGCATEAGAQSGLAALKKAIVSPQKVDLPPHLAHLAGGANS